MRPFGSDLSDLDVDFTAAPPFVVTELLCRCAALDSDTAWDLPVGARTEATVALTALSAPQSWSIVLRCPNGRCREALEIDLDPKELREWSSRSPAGVSIEVHGHQRALRRPTGRDQRTWLSQSWSDAAATRRGMLASLLTGVAPDDLAEHDIEAIETALGEMEPLVGFTATVTCPACRSSAEHTLPLEQHALRALRRVQERLLESVVRLAARFHWSERDILALPAWRRDRYLALGESAR